METQTENQKEKDCEVFRAAKMEYGQVVRQWTLNPSYKGSIPFTPEKCI